MKKVCCVLLLMFSASGCSLIEVRQGAGKETKIPVKPQISRKLEEAVRQEAQVAKDAAVVIYENGTEAKSKEAAIVNRAADKMLTFIGKPSEPIQWSDEEALERLHKTFETELEKNRDETRKWENIIMSLKEQNKALEAERSKWELSFNNLKFWFWILIIVIVALCVLFPSLIPVFLRWGKKGVEATLKATRRQMKEVIDGIQEFRESDGDEEIDVILAKHQSADTKHLVHKLKNGHFIEGSE